MSAAERFFGVHGFKFRIDERLDHAPPQYCQRCESKMEAVGFGGRTNIQVVYVCLNECGEARNGARLRQR